MLWIEISAFIFGATVVVIEPILLLMFAIVFMVKRDNGKVSRVSAMICIGNGHKNSVDGLIY
jgi:hypothetical protein